jgi:hypothetical protein
MKTTDGSAIWVRDKSGLNKMDNFYFGHKLRAFKSGAPGAIRTRAPRFRRPPSEKDLIGGASQARRLFAGLVI